MQTNNLETLSKQEIRAYSGDSFYVLNTSDREGRESRAEILMTFKGNGDAETIEIKNTWIPIDLMTRVPLRAILDNKDFWHHINKRAITVITTEAAEEFLARPEAMEEFDRVYEISEEEREKANKTGNNRTTVDMDERILAQHRGTLAKGNIKRELGSAKVISIMKRESITEQNRLAALRNIQHELKADDYKYIIKEARGEGQDRIKEWATTAQMSVVG